MKASAILMIVGSVSLTTVAQITLKFGMMNGNIQKFISERDYYSLIFSIVTSPYIILGMLFFALSVAIWLAVLAEVPLSIAYPFVAFGICMTTAAGSLLFREPITSFKVIGMAMIVAGISFISAS